MRSIVSRTAIFIASSRPEAHHDPMRGRFSARPQKSHILAHDELKFSSQPRFDRSYVDLRRAPWAECGTTALPKSVMTTTATC
jgi:hypothetical protein